MASSLLRTSVLLICRIWSPGRIIPLDAATLSASTYTNQNVATMQDVVDRLYIINLDSEQGHKPPKQHKTDENKEDLFTIVSKEIILKRVKYMYLSGLVLHIVLLFCIVTLM